MRLPFFGDYPITQLFGERPEVYSQWGLKGHNGIDWGIPNGTIILAPIAGRVITAAIDPPGYGTYVQIESDKEGCTLGHGQALLVARGDLVREGDPVLVSDNTGFSSGPHLHFGYWPIPRYSNNGYNGYINQYNLLFKEFNLDEQIAIVYFESEMSLWNPGAGICQSWLTELKEGRNKGVVLSNEFSHNGKVYQHFSAGIACWDPSDNIVTWY